MRYVHEDDWKELERSLVKSLESHFRYWDKVFKKIQDWAVEAFQKLDHEHGAYRKEYREYLDQIMELFPRNDERMLNLKRIEEVLLSVYE